MSLAPGNNLPQVFAGPDMNASVGVRRPGLFDSQNRPLNDEPVHFRPLGSDGKDGLAQASEAWFNVLNPLLQAKSIEPITPFKLGTEPTTLNIDPGNNIATAPAASRVYWVKDDNGSFDVGISVAEGRTVALNSTGRKRAVLVDATGNYTVTQAMDFPFVVNNSEPAISSLALGCYTIQSQKTGNMMQDMGDGRIKQRTANGQNNQIFRADDAGSNRLWFTTQSGTNKIVTTPSGSNGQELLLNDYSLPPGSTIQGTLETTATGAANQQWSVEQNGSSGNYRIFTPTGGATWDLRSGGDSQELQIYGRTNEPFYDYRSFRFNAVTCPGNTTNPDPTPPTNDACTAFTNGTVVGYRTYETNVQVVVGENGGCKRALWSTGGVMHENWLPSITATGNFTTATIRQCLKFEGEACGSTPPGPNPCAFTVSVNPANPSAAAGASVQLTAQCSGQCDAVSYSWSGNGLNASGTPVNLTAPASAGQYTYTLTASKSACGNKTATAQITVNANTGGRCAAFTNGTEIGYRSGNAGAKVVVQDDGVCRKAMWSNGDGQMHPNWIPYATFYSTFSPEDIRYCLTFDGETCKRPASVTPAPAPATAFAVGNTGTGMAEESPARVSSGARPGETAPTATEGPELVAYPNPTNDVLTVRLDQSLPAQPRYVLTDVSGRACEVGSHLSVLGERRIKLSVRHLPTGVYLLQIGTAPGSAEVFRPRVVRFVKQ